VSIKSEDFEEKPWIFYFLAAGGRSGHQELNKNGLSGKTRIFIAQIFVHFKFDEKCGLIAPPRTELIKKRSFFLKYVVFPLECLPIFLM
jgi:hypothetical protein